MSDKGTISWLPIEDAPHHDTLFLYDDIVYIGGWNFCFKYWSTANGDEIQPTHFAYINTPNTPEVSKEND